MKCKGSDVGGLWICRERCHNLDAYGNNPSRNIQYMLGYQLLACGKEWNPFSLTQNLLHFLWFFFLLNYFCVHKANITVAQNSPMTCLSACLTCSFIPTAFFFFSKLGFAYRYQSVMWYFFKVVQCLQITNVIIPPQHVSYVFMTAKFYTLGEYVAPHAESVSGEFFTASQLFFLFILFTPWNLGKLC